MMMVTLANLGALLSEAQADAARSAKSNAFGGLASLMINSVGLGWGWVLLFGGAFGVLALALLAPRQNTSENDVRPELKSESTSFEAADRAIAEYLKNRPISPAISKTGQQTGFGKRGQ
jgi:hypothetical protein